MMRIFHIISFFVLILFSISTSFASHQTRPFNPEDADFIQAFRCKNKFKNLAAIEVINPKSACAEAVIFIKLQNSSNSFAIKVFKDILDFHNERMLFREDKIYISLINELNQDREYDLPKIIEYKGSVTINGRGAILFPKAEGKNISALRSVWLLRSSEDTPIMSADQIMDTFTTIGTQLGNLDAMLFTKYNHKRLVHPDDHPGNFIYNKNERQLYWIDTAGLKLIEDSNVPHPAQNYRFVRAMEANVTLGQYKLDPSSLSDAIYWRINFQNELLALTSLYKGYAQALDSWDISNAIMLILKTQAEPQVQKFNIDLANLNLPPITIAFE